eukprot:m51a1_g705 hypothetical protein (712) ;mRNA; f:393938-396482
MARSFSRRFRTCLSSIHTKAILSFLVICVAVLVAMGASSHSFIDVFSNIETTAVEGNIKRVLTSIAGDASILEYTMRQYSVWNKTVDVVKDLLNNSDTKYDAWLKSNYFVGGQWNTDMGLNLVALFAPRTYALLKIEWYPPDANSSITKNKSSSPPSFFGDTALFEQRLGSVCTASKRYVGILNIPNSSEAPLIVAMLPVYPSSGASTPQGWLLWGQTFGRNELQYANAAPACLRWWSLGDARGSDRALFEKLTPRLLTATDDWHDSQWHKGTSERSRLEKDPRRICPPLLPNAKNTSDDITGFFLLTDNLNGSTPGPLIRVDTSRELLIAGQKAVAALTSVVIIIVVLVSIGFIAFLDIAVLRRLDRLKKYMYSASKVKEVPADADATTQQGADSGNEGTGSHANSSDSSDKASLTSGSSGLNAPRDEIGNLEYAMRRKLGQLQSRLESCLADLEEELRKSERTTAAMRLMNLCSGRSSEPPGVKLPEPPVPPLDLRTILSSPLATELLKAFCVSENLMPFAVQFLADVAWIRNIEAAAAEAQPEDAKMLREAVENAAAVVRERYAGKTPVTTLPCSEKALARMRKTGHGSSVFDSAAADVMQALSQDVMPKFHKSTAHAAVALVMSSEKGEAINDPSNGVQAVFAGARLRAASKLAPPPPSPKLESVAEPEVPPPPGPPPVDDTLAMEIVPTPLDGEGVQLQVVDNTSV